MSNWEFCQEHKTSFLHSAGRYCLYCHIRKLEAEREGMALVPEDIALHIADYWSQDFTLGGAWDYMPEHPVILWAKKYTAQQFEPTAEPAVDSPECNQDYRGS